MAALSMKAPHWGAVDASPPGSFHSLRQYSYLTGLPMLLPALAALAVTQAVTNPVTLV